MRRSASFRSGRFQLAAVVAAIAWMATGCEMAPFGGGGSLQLNVTDVQTRALSVRVNAADREARILEVGLTEETELGQGSATVDRYVLQRVTFGPQLAVGLFLCAKPCSRPTEDYLVAYSPDQLFSADGELRLQFRVVHSGDASEELSRIIGPQSLLDLWRQPVVAIEVGSDLF